MTELRDARIGEGAFDRFAFVMNVSELADANGYDLLPGHRLRRATNDEIAQIKDMLRQRLDAMIIHLNLWETRWPLMGSMEIRPQEEWRYFVIAFQGSNASIVALETTFALSAVELQVAFTLVGRGGVVWNASALFHAVPVGPIDRTFFRPVGAAEIDEIRSLHEQIERHDNAVLDLSGPLLQLQSLKSLPRTSPLSFLGYFAILESMLTHNPKPSDPYESITRQVKKKVALLDRRWTPGIDYAPFGGCPPEKVWGKMYEYRSLVAHGGRADFQKGSLAALRDAVTALRLIKETTKAAIRQGLREPQLLADLKDC